MILPSFVSAFIDHHPLFKMGLKKPEKKTGGKGIKYVK